MKYLTRLLAIDGIKTCLGALLMMESVLFGSWLVSEYWFTWLGLPSALICFFTFFIGMVISIHDMTEPKKMVSPEKCVESTKEPEVVAWIYEDELSEAYPYDLMYPYSRVDGVRLFPVFKPTSKTKG